MIATALTWLQAFKGPCAALAIAAVLAGGGAGWWGATKVAEGRVQRAERNLSDFRAEIATRASEAEQAAGARQTAYERALRERDQTITSAVDQIPGRVAAMLGPIRADLRSLINAPQYDCLRTQPLPADYLERLHQPAGSALAAPDR